MSLIQLLTIVTDHHRFDTLICHVGQKAETLDLLFFSRTTPPFKLTLDHFQLGCTPMINLFSERFTLTIKDDLKTSALCEDYEYPVAFLRN